MKPTIYQPRGRNRYCGPTAVSAITGVSTDEAAALMREWSGRTSIKGSSIGELAAALRARGCSIEGTGTQFSRMPTNERPTMAEWLRTHQRPANKHVVVIFRHHFGVLLGRRYICAQSGGVTSLADIPGRRGRVSGWLTVTMPTKPMPPIEPKKTARPAGASALFQAKLLALGQGINIERDRDGYWVTSNLFDDGDNDPRQGSHFCVGGEEVLEAVEAYVKAHEEHAAATA